MQGSLTSTPQLRQVRLWEWDTEPERHASKPTRLALVPSLAPVPPVRHRTPKRPQALAVRCVGSLPLRPVEGDTMTAVAEALALAKRRQRCA
ncbi:MAG TPA: hypothetical protein VG538_11430 [Vicinamibacterales bacterium]|jgi:hypothetical protein|nr:hypothetical protein [Vicinamibacterales bacterium]